MPSNADRLSSTWLQSSEPCDPWVLTGTNPLSEGWRDAVIGNGLIGQRIDAMGGSSTYELGSGSFMHGMWGAARENPKRPMGMIELPHWAKVSVGDGERDLRRPAMRTVEHQQQLDLKTGRVHTHRILEGSLGPINIATTTWLCRQQPNLAVMEYRIRRPQGGIVDITEMIDAQHMTDLATGSAIADKGQFSLTVRSSHFDREISVSSTLVVQSPHTLTLDLAQSTSTHARRRWTVRLAADEELAFTKLVAITSDRDLETSSSLDYAQKLLGQHRTTIADLNNGHDAAWNDIWQHWIEVPHPRLQQLCNVALYHHYITLRHDSRWSHAPCGLAGNGWDGLIFWDTDTWTFPVYGYFNPDMAKGCVQYRYDQLAGAMENAAQNNESGARWPWMSGENGSESCSLHVFQNERHIVSCVALAQWQYAQFSGDNDWLRNEGLAVICGSAEYWAQKVSKNDDGSYSINGVCGADEHAGIVDDNATTNAGAQWTLRMAHALATEAGKNPPDLWLTIADNLRMLWIDEPHIPQQMASWQDGQVIKQADTSLLVYPWQYPLTEDCKRDLVAYYRKHYDNDLIMMGRSIDGIVDCELGNSEQAWDELRELCTHCTLPFLVPTESTVNERLPFVTGFGGLLQLIVAGFAGLRVKDDHLAINPALPAALSGLTLHGIHYQGQAFDCEITGESVNLSRADGLAIEVSI